MKEHCHTLVGLFVNLRIKISVLGREGLQSWPNKFEFLRLFSMESLKVNSVQNGSIG